MFRINNITKDNKMVNNNYLLMRLLIIILLLIPSCKKDNPIGPTEERFDAGPILFVSNKSGTWQLYSMNEDGSGIKQLTKNSDLPISDARWSPDGSKIVFVSRDTRLSLQQMSSALYVMNADGTGMYKLTNPPIESFSYPLDTKPIWSPDGNRVAFSRLMPPEISGDFDVFIINVDGKNETRITNYRNLLEYTGTFVDDSTILSFYFDYARYDTSGKADGKGQIAYLDMQGNYHTISPYEADDGAPVLSPNKMTIAFSSLGTRNGTWGRFLHLMTANGINRKQIQISERQHESSVDWSSDGQKILCMTSDPNKPEQPYENYPQDILIFSLVDSTVSKITPFPYKEAYSRPTSWRRR